jgi:uncharacterized membrane protein (UPF0127 family)
MGTNERRRKKNRRDVILIIAFVLLAGVGFYFYNRNLTPRVEAQIGSRKFTLEVADTPDKQTKGLMFRRELPSSEGMIFIYESEKINSMWMKNTYIPLDMIFLDKDKKVVGILENVPPLTLDSRRVDKPSRYVIELNAGTVKEVGLKVGDLVKF